MLDHMMDFIEDNKTYMQKYARYNNMKIYSDVASIFEVVKESEVFLCSHNVTHKNLNLSQLFCVLKYKNNSLQKVNIECDDNKGIIIMVKGIHT